MQSLAGVGTKGGGSGEGDRGGGVGRERENDGEQHGGIHQPHNYNHPDDPPSTTHTLEDYIKPPPSTKNHPKQLKNQTKKEKLHAAHLTTITGPLTTQEAFGSEEGEQEALKVLRGEFPKLDAALVLAILGDFEGDVGAARGVLRGLAVLL